MSLLASLRLAAHPVLEFAVTSDQVPIPGAHSPDDAGKTSHAEFPLTVTLDHTYLEIDAPARRTIYDFSRRRLLELDLAHGRYTDNSLYVDIAFRSLELQNRMMLGQMLQSAQLDSPQSPPLLEQLFSISAPNEATRVEERREGDDRAFCADGDKLVSLSDKTRALPEGFQPDYWRFLRYYVSAWPAPIEAGSTGVLLGG